MKEELLKLARERGLLLERGVLDLLESLDNIGLAKELLLNIERISGEKIISSKLLEKNFEFVGNIVKKLSGEKKNLVENTFIKLGMSLEVRKERRIIDEANEADSEKNKIKQALDYKVFYADTKPEKKLEVKDFTNHFRARYSSLQRILMHRPELQTNLISINKISNDRQSLSVIGIVTEKRLTKNKNMIIKFEDLTGEISCLVKADNEEVFIKANELLLDDIIGVKGSGNRDIIFVHDLVYPDSFLYEKTKFNEDINIAFLSDLHCGSDRHLSKSLENFFEWINSEEDDAKKIKYLFFVGDNVDGVGIFPGQEQFLKMKSMGEQYSLLASYLRKVPKNITMFMCPGQHDATRVAEPQPLIDKKYAKELYDIENLVLVTNPCLVKLIEKSKLAGYDGFGGSKYEDKEFKVLMYHGASIHGFINEIKELREMKAHKCPAKAVRHMLKRRHLAPTHGVVVYIPNADCDPMAISEVPNVLCTGEVHRLDVENYNGVLIITGSCWQAQTSFEEKVGNIPDPCKVPIMNLKTGGLKIYDFGVKEEIERWM